VETADRRDNDSPRRTGGNDADLHYLEEARAALRLVIPLSDAASDRAAGGDVRALARAALDVQIRQLEAISVCLLPWDRPEVAGPQPAVAESLPRLHGTALDRAYVGQLATHAHTSMTAARAEMVAGVSGGVRAIAEGALRSQSRQLAALDRLPPGSPM
jgi:hypothetical protein